MLLAILSHFHPTVSLGHFRELVECNFEKTVHWTLSSRQNSATEAQTILQGWRGAGRIPVNHMSSS